MTRFGAIDAFRLPGAGGEKKCSTSLQSELVAVE